MTTTEKPFRILTIDGGGIRGIYAAHILERIKSEFNIEFEKEFDLIAGTSTGSIIAAGLALGVPIGDIVRFYEEKAEDVFSEKNLSLWGMIKSLYKKESLKELLVEVFEERVLSEAKTRLMIPATDISNGTVHVFKSNYLPEFVRDTQIKVCDAVLASCSAPMYFDPEKVGDYLLSDGGLWANNPALTGLIEAVGKLKVPIEKVHILSIGTGIGKKYYDPARLKKPWGLIHWNPAKLVLAILNLQSIASQNAVQLMLPTERYLRINFETDGTLPMDKHQLISQLKAKADHDFTHNSEKIKNLL